MAATAPPTKLLLRVDEARAMLSLNRNAMYRLLMSGAIYSFKEGGVRLIPAAELAAYVERHLSERPPITAAVPALRHPPRLLSRGKEEVGRHGR
jgi:excisionase family DNA binding protein